MQRFNLVIAVFLLAWSTTVHAQILSGYENVEIVKNRMKELPLQDVEGLWRFPANGTIIALERDDDVASRFKIVVVDSPYPSMDPGYLLGYA